MDQDLDGPFDSSSGFRSENQSMPQTGSISSTDFEYDCEFPGGVLRYIDHMLMEEDMEGETHMLQESLDFQAKERSFYEVLGQKYPPSPPQESDDLSRQDNNNYYNSTTSGSDGSGYLIDVINPSWRKDYTVSKGMLDQNPKESEINLEEDEVIIKNSHFARCKQNAAESNNSPTEEFDDVWVYTLGGSEKELAAHIADLKISACNNMPQRGVKGMKQNKTDGVIDLTSLLVDCAKYISSDDCGSAYVLLRQIRQHSSPFGDGSQRLAHYFANGLEARLTGTVSEMHHDLLHKRMTDSDYLKAYFTSFVSSSFRKISNFASNKLIVNNSKNATKVHIIDFGINFGFQWPTFIQRVSQREGGPPKLRITGIDFPQPGSQPAERIEDTGRRLAYYAKVFNVPFEYNAIAQGWETIKIEDLKIEKGEFLAVNCLYLAKNLLDETVGAVSSRNMVLDLIRKINPDIFIHGIVNGSYSLPLFFPRFREVLYHFSALFDMMDKVIPRERPERMLIESTLGKEALNVIACEGWERVERPETYKQWDVRHLRAGFMKIPLERKVMKSLIYKVRKFYHKDFIVDEENNWVLMSWNGRIICAISCWKPV